MQNDATVIIIFGDQLSPSISSLKNADKSRDVIVMAEVSAEASYVCLLYTSDAADE